MERVAAISASVAAVLVLDALPVLTSILSRSLYFDASQIAAFGAADLFCLAAGNLAAAPLMNRWTVRALTIGGLGLLVAADLGALWIHSASGLTILRMLGGFAGGIAAGACTYVFGLANQVRNVAASTIGQTASTFASTLAIPPLAAAFGWQSSFVYFAVLASLPLCLTPYIRDLRPRDPTAINGLPQARVSHIRLPIWLGVIGATTFFIGTGAMWTFLEQIGFSSGLRARVIDRAMWICAASGFISSILALALGPRITRQRTLLYCVALNLVGTAAALSTNGWIYTAAISIYYFSVPIIMACQFGAVSIADESRLGAIYVSAGTFAGFAIGPPVGAYLIERVGYSGLLWLNIALVILAVPSTSNLISGLRRPSTM
jgi:predicted MFS family arabinose efflux permease